MPVRGAFIDERESVRHNPSLLAAAIMTWLEALAPQYVKEPRAAKGKIEDFSFPDSRYGT
jgi:hypothetical protein